MPKIWRVYSGSDGQSHIAEETPAMKPFTDTEGSYGEAAPTQAASSITFRMSPPGYVLDWHCAPRRQYSISLSGMAEIEVGDGTVARVGPGDVVLAEDLTGRGHVTRVVGPSRASTRSCRSPRSNPSRSRASDRGIPIVGQRTSALRGSRWPATGSFTASSSVLAWRHSLAGRAALFVPIWSMFQ